MDSDNIRGKIHYIDGRLLILILGRYADGTFPVTPPSLAVQVGDAINMVKITRDEAARLIRTARRKGCLS